MGKAKDGSECYTRTGKGGGKYVTCEGTQKGGARKKAETARKELRKKVPETKKNVTKAQFENARRKLAGGTATGKSKKPAPKKKLGVKIEKPKEVKKSKTVSLEFLKELSQKKGYSFNPEGAFKSLKVGEMMTLDYDDAPSKVVKLVSSDEKGITFDEFNHKVKRTELHSGPNTQANPKFYVQTILGEKKPKQLKLTWSQFYRVRRTKNTPVNVRDVKTAPYKRRGEK